MNHPLLEDLRAAYRSGNLVVFAGAGVSAAAGLPTWKRLAESLVEQLRARNVGGDDIPDIEEYIRRDKYIEALSAAKLALGAQEFGLLVERMLDNRGKQVPDVARAIARLAPTLRAVVTTNLDSFFEEAFGGKWHPFVEPPGDLAQQRHYILKMHGTLRDRSSWVFSRDQYDHAMFRSPKLQATFGALYRAYPILFVGCGLADDNLDLTLGQVRALADEQPPQHFALLPQPVGQLRKKQIQDAGIRLITYANTDGKHAEVLAILQTLLDDGSATVPQTIPNEDGRSPDASRPDYWQITLLARTLDSEIRSVSDKKHDAFYGVTYVPTERLTENIHAIDWLHQAFERLGTIADGLTQLMTESVPAAIGQSGVPAEEDAIVYVAKKAAEGYKAFADWVLDIRSTVTSQEFAPLVKIALNMGRDAMGQMEGWAAQLLDAVQQGRDTGAVKCSLRLEIRDTDELQREFKRLSNKLLLPSALRSALSAEDLELVDELMDQVEEQFRANKLDYEYNLNVDRNRIIPRKVWQALVHRVKFAGHHASLTGAIVRIRHELA